MCRFSRFCCLCGKRDMPRRVLICILHGLRYLPKWCRQRWRRQAYARLSSSLHPQSSHSLPSLYSQVSLVVMLFIKLSCLLNQAVYYRSMSPWQPIVAGGAYGSDSGLHFPFLWMKWMQYTYTFLLCLTICCSCMCVAIFPFLGLMRVIRGWRARFSRTVTGYFPIESRPSIK